MIKRTLSLLLCVRDLGRCRMFAFGAGQYFSSGRND